MCGAVDTLLRPFTGGGNQNVMTTLAAPADALDPSRSPLPDPNDSSAVQARLREKQRLQMLAGYRQLFLSGPRGPGGPTLADQNAQLNPPDPVPASTGTSPIADAAAAGEGTLTSRNTAPADKKPPRPRGGPPVYQK